MHSFELGASSTLMLKLGQRVYLVWSGANGSRMVQLILRHWILILSCMGSSSRQILKAKQKREEEKLLQEEDVKTNQDESDFGKRMATWTNKKL
ncbi:hypothetical protein AKJ16_DCAP22964 [Drosera capensis]